MKQYLASPNGIIWNYFKALGRLVRDIGNLNEEEQKQSSVLSIFLSVTIVEAFLNIYFRIVVDEQPFIVHRDLFLSDLNERKSLDYKIKNWPTKIFGRGIDLTKGIGEKFIQLKEKRNSLMHFQSTHQTIEFDKGMSICGLTDTTVYETLSVEDAISAVATAEGVLEEIFKLRGVSQESIPQHMHLWTGKVPI